MTSNMLTVDLKITLDTIQRRFLLPTTCPAWDDLAALVKDGFELPERFKLGLCYKDQDGEYITVSSTKELASVWPNVTADDERDLDALPPLRFSVVEVPSHMDSHGFHGHPSAHPGHRGRHTRFGDFWLGQHMDGPDVHDSPEPPKDGPKPPKDGPKPPKDGNKDSLKQDVHRFIEAVKHNVTDNKEVQDAYTKLMEHARSEHGPKKPKEGAAANVFGEVAMQTDSSDGLTSGMVAAMLTPAFLGPPHHAGPHHGPPGGPPHGPPPHHGPHHGRPHREHPHHGPPGHGPPGCGPHHRPGFEPGHDHPRGPGRPHRGPGGPSRGPRRHHDEDGPPPPHGRFGPGHGRPHGRHGGPFGGRHGGHEHHGRWAHEGPGRRFRGHPYYAHPSFYRRKVDEDTETVASLDSDFELDSDIEDITQGVREMHRNTGVF